MDCEEGISLVRATWGRRCAAADREGRPTVLARAGAESAAVTGSPVGSRAAV